MIREMLSIMGSIHVHVHTRFLLCARKTLCSHRMKCNFKPNLDGINYVNEEDRKNADKKCVNVNV